MSEFKNNTGHLHLVQESYLIAGEISRVCFLMNF